MKAQEYSRKINASIREIEEEECLAINFFRNVGKAALLNQEQNVKVLENIETSVYEKSIKTKQVNVMLAKKLEEIKNTREEEEQVFNALQTEKKELENKLEEMNVIKNELINRKVDNPKQPKIEDLKKAIKACRILTCTHFDFGPVVCGYTLGPDLKYKSFIWDPQEMSQQEITQCLWENLSQFSTFSLNRKVNEVNEDVDKDQPKT